MAGSKCRSQAAELTPVESLRIGIVAIQGGFAAHAKTLSTLGADTVEVRTVTELEEVDGLVIPGGESTTILKGLTDCGLAEPLRNQVSQGMPTFATCAGVIVLARERLELLDLSVLRNAYGRQIHSFETELQVDGSLAVDGEPFIGVFIRAPWMEELGPGVEVLAEHNSHPVAVRQESILACAFHPELTDDPRFHALFLRMVRGTTVPRLERRDERIKLGTGAQ